MLHVLEGHRDEGEAPNENRSAGPHGPLGPLVPKNPRDLDLEEKLFGLTTVESQWGSGLLRGSGIPLGGDGGGRTPPPPPPGPTSHQFRHQKKSATTAKHTREETVIRRWARKKRRSFIKPSFVPWPIPKKKL